MRRLDYADPNQEPGFWDDRPNYERKPLSNYEGYKRLEAGLEKAAQRGDHRVLCQMCKQWKASRHVVPSELLGRAMPPFSVKMLECCADCATLYRAAGIR